uniref:NB-ARC domain-containing protein n=1 Tax=Oryza punctata TaxID=4537 RepID=A0A0E0LRR1_ORYPU
MSTRCRRGREEEEDRVPHQGARERAHCTPCSARPVRCHRISSASMHVRQSARDLREASYDMTSLTPSWCVLTAANTPPPPADLGTLRRRLRKVSKLFKSKPRLAGCKIDGANQDIKEKLQGMAASKLVGIEGQMEKIINMISLGNDVDDDMSSDKTMKMVSIVGIGGLGIAKAVYDRFKLDFDCGAFVPVGQLPSVNKMNRQLIDELHEFLQNKRCFIVIDELWDKKSWGLIRCALQGSNCGSKIVATTRIFEVATFVGNVYEMKPLSHDDSRKLLYARIIVGEGESLVTPSAKILKVHDMEVLGRLSELRFLGLHARHTEMVSTEKTDGDGYFWK